MIMRESFLPFAVNAYAEFNGKLVLQKYISLQDLLSSFFTHYVALINHFQLC
jgi:hypothetical protein